MDKAISTKIKKILKVKPSKAKISYKSPKQVAKQSQVVIINQDRPKRSYTKRGKATMGGEGGGGGGSGDPKIVYIPTSFPNFNIPAQNPQIISQPIPQMIREFEPTPVYRNPLRMEPFISALNPAPFNQNQPGPSNIEGNLANVQIAPPPPLEPEIVLEPNSLFMPSTPVPAYPIMSSSSPTQGFTENAAVNQLNQEVGAELKAYDDFGGYDAHAEDERIMRLAKQLSGGEFYRKKGRIQTSDSESEIASRGGYMSMSEAEGRKSNKGRPFTALTEEDKGNILLYIFAKNDKSIKSELSESDKKNYSRGRKLISQNKKNNPEVISLIQDIKDKFGYTLD